MSISALFNSIILKLKRVFSLVIVVSRDKSFVAFLHIVSILMEVKRIVLGYFNYAGCDIRAMVGNSLKIREKIGQNEAVLYRTLAILQTANVIKLYLIAKVYKHPYPSDTR